MKTEGPLPFHKNVPIPKPYVTFHNKIVFLQRGVVSLSSNPIAGGPLLVRCLRLLIQYVRSYSPSPPSATRGRAMTPVMSRHEILILFAKAWLSSNVAGAQKMRPEFLIVLLSHSVMC